LCRYKITVKNSERKKTNVLSTLDIDRANAHVKENPHADQITRLEYQKDKLVSERKEVKLFLDNQYNGSADQRRAKRIRLRQISSELRDIGIKIDLLQV
jgi:hypothetical protein